MPYYSHQQRPPYPHSVNLLYTFVSSLPPLLGELLRNPPRTMVVLRNAATVSRQVSLGSQLSIHKRDGHIDLWFDLKLSEVILWFSLQDKFALHFHFQLHTTTRLYAVMRPCMQPHWEDWWIQTCLPYPCLACVHMGIIYIHAVMSFYLVTMHCLCHIL